LRSREQNPAVELRDRAVRRGAHLAGELFKAMAALAIVQCRKGVGVAVTDVVAAACR
jgi:hypothetical protein